MNRKMIVATLVIFFLHHLTSSHAQKKAAIPRIGLINAGAPGDPQSQAFLEGLREFGYIDGKNILIESRYANGKVHRLPEFAHELVKMKVDAIYTSNTRSMLAVKKLTKTIPIVIVSTTDPVQSGTRCQSGPSRREYYWRFAYCLRISGRSGWRLLKEVTLETLTRGDISEQEQCRHGHRSESDVGGRGSVGCHVA